MAPDSLFQLHRHAPRPGARELMADGVAWLVYVLPAASERWRVPTLVFESEAKVRRVRAFPADWADLSDDELLALSWSR